ncbi:MAG: MarR family winged helix-turn-helix transcriptional regulator [Streptococcus sp.]|nr:MarR family winged helix-turn-helix transcriptional regulator [Streptococcus sp.]
MIENFSQILYQLKLVNQNMTNLFESKIGISLTRFQLLIFLQSHEPCSQIRLQEGLKIDQAAITRHIKVLVNDGYLVKERNPKNNREILVSLTSKAKEKLGKCQNAEELKQDFLKADLTNSDLMLLAQLLEKMNTAISQK